MNIQLSIEDVCEAFGEPVRKPTTDENGFSSDRLRSRFAAVIPELAFVSDDAFDIALFVIVNRDSLYKGYEYLKLLVKHLVKRARGQLYSVEIVDNFQYGPIYLDLMDKFTVGQLTGETTRKSRRFNRLVQNVIDIIREELELMTTIKAGTVLTSRR